MHWIKNNPGVCRDCHNYLYNRENGPPPEFPQTFEDELLWEKSALDKNWRTCAPQRSCTSCCMFRKNQAMSKWNTVEWVKFMVAPALNTAWEVGACIEDCYF